MSSPKILVLGGAASGKSEFAEELTCGLGPERLYLATGEAHDEEMRRKIEIHVARRGAGWDLAEAPLDPAPALKGRKPVLFDCATMWLSNHMMAGSDLEMAQENLLAALAACPAPVVIVTNETGQGVVPENALARAFREAQGRLNIRLARQCDCVVQVIAGLPNILKGTLP